MEAAEFIKRCQKVVADYETGGLSLLLAAAAINDRHDFQLEEPTHPMVYKIADLAFDISEDYRSEDEQMEDWKIITKTLHNYVSGKWESTCFRMSLVYGVYSGTRLTRSYSVSASRQNGATILETAVEELQTVFDKIVESVNPEQTDERYLQNIRQLAPDKVDEYKFVSCTAGEYLTDPYYSTADS